MSVVFTEISSHWTCTVGNNISEAAVVNVVKQSAGNMGMIFVVVSEILTLIIEKQYVVCLGCYVILLILGF